MVPQELGRPIVPPFCPCGVRCAVQQAPPQRVVVKRVGIVVIDRRVGAVAEPSAADRHGFQLVEEAADRFVVARLAEVLAPQELQREHAEKEVVVAVQLFAPDAAEPLGDLGLLLAVERTPKRFAGDVQGEHQRSHLNVVLVMIAGRAPILRIIRIGAMDQAAAEPFGDLFARKGIRIGRFLVFALQPVRGPEAGARERLEAVGLFTVVARFADQREFCFARLHECDQRTEAFLRDAQPCLVIE